MIKSVYVSPITAAQELDHLQSGSHYSKVRGYPTCKLWVTSPQIGCKDPISSHRQTEPPAGWWDMKFPGPRTCACSGVRVLLWGKRHVFLCLRHISHRKSPPIMQCELWLFIMFMYSVPIYKQFFFIINGNWQSLIHIYLKQSALVSNNYHPA